jgi:ribosome-interacting GTPase 1
VPANLTPEYRAAEAAFRKAREPKERLQHLRDMLRLIPKHKGTDHLQADIKRRIKELTEELEAPKKGGARSSVPTTVRPEGAAQIALLGPPNSGKSELHARLTGSAVHAAPYPFTTQFPQAGMLAYEDVAFQLVDLPAVSPEHPVPWLASSLQSADACLLVVDLAEADCLEQIEALHAVLQAQRVHLTSRWGSRAEEEDPFTTRLPVLLVANKADRLADAQAELRAFMELESLDYPALAVSAKTGYGLGEIGPWLFSHLGVVRVYTKSPGKPADRTRPFTLRVGQKVEDVARLVHQDLAHSLRYARIWGKSGFDGQHVGREHVLKDGDVVELHS